MHENAIQKPRTAGEKQNALQGHPDGFIALSDLKLNDGNHGLPKNPRFIRDERFRALCQSVRDNPEYMPARPIIVNEAGVILGGNMRWRACVENGMKEIPASWVQRVVGWPLEKQRRFVLIDNRTAGEDDLDILGNEFSLEELLSVGIELPLFTETDEEPTEETKEDLRPIRRCHVLISMTSDQALELLPVIDKALEGKDVDIRHAGN
ncbi:MAG: hypothetical protein PHH26_01620 [Candidatus Thermoplasmatota archaeon]|nr:hypothetical protein [Candidatus Thermoplasmatota archaeon]